MQPNALNILLILGVVIQTIEPGLVDTLMANRADVEKRRQPKVMSAAKHTMVSVDKFVNSAINTIGWADAHEGHIMHYIVGLITKVQGRSQDSYIVKDMINIGL